MRQQSLLARATETVSTIAGGQPDAAAALGRIEDVRLRNYDGEDACSVSVRLERDGEAVFSRTYDLPPEATASAVDAVGPGRYDVVVEVDGKLSVLADCRIDERPEHTVLVEVGNGVVSLSTVDP